MHENSSFAISFHNIQMKHTYIYTACRPIKTLSSTLQLKIVCKLQLKNSIVKNSLWSSVKDSVHFSVPFQNQKFNIKLVKFNIS